MRKTRKEEIISIEDKCPDVEALITNTRESKTSFASGYRPAHLVHSNYLTTGSHKYYDKDWVHFGETVLGSITFISPEVYPKCLWIGKKIVFQEGAKITGHAIITKIFNKILESDAEGVEGELNLVKKCK